MAKTKSTGPGSAAKKNQASQEVTMTESQVAPNENIDQAPVEDAGVENNNYPQCSCCICCPESDPDDQPEGDHQAQEHENHEGGTETGLSSSSSKAADKPPPAPPGARRCGRCRKTKCLNCFFMQNKVCEPCLVYCREVTRKNPGGRSGTGRKSKQQPDLAPPNADDDNVARAGPSSSHSAETDEEQTTSEAPKTNRKRKREAESQPETSEPAAAKKTRGGNGRGKNAAGVAASTGGRGRAAQNTAKNARASTFTSASGSRSGSASGVTSGSADDAEMADASEDGGHAAAPAVTVPRYTVRSPVVLPALRYSRPRPETRAQRFDAMFPRGTGEQ
ncbi:hypothetical protein SODALDRAFT_400805 [Sodiomyces alkalinus F11]|uniref:Uncharacterized protein n=1 Tax=Sodiomyces alkalinus (strain CBS 110278 / VKM F-3762 / F11) TaxID=1314773 RepID=A0A3N2PRJ2_SODAK|nr:hypothetical protein SODALDRAFT_400805 [Sodiomyces alkalinus F11]ROT37117.1 hypothetical protein SODALDRAFT_400805 [Sodiomyces alkalinus F11]